MHVGLKQPVWRYCTAKNSVHAAEIDAAWAGQHFSDDASEIDVLHGTPAVVVALDVADVKVSLSTPPRVFPLHEVVIKLIIWLMLTKHDVVFMD